MKIIRGSGKIYEYDYVYIPVHPETKNKSAALGKKGDTYDMLVLKLIKNQKGKGKSL